MLDLFAERVGSERWSLFALEGTSWRGIHRESSPKDDLYLAIARSLAIPTVGIRATAELGDMGARLEATGVSSLLVIAGGSGSEPGVLFFEDPSPDAQDLIEELGDDKLDRALMLARGALEFERRSQGVDVLRRWLPGVDELSRGELDDATGIEMLGAAAGASSVVAVRQMRQGLRVATAMRGTGKRWKQNVSEVEGELSGSPEADDEVISSAAAAAKVTMGDSWVRGRSPDGMLVIASDAQDLSPSLLDVCATILAFASERSADSSAARSNAMLQERARIASVMHEGITQVLTNVAIQMEVLDQLLGEPEAARKMLASLRTAILEALDSLRGAILELNPTAPEWTDLAGGLERFTKDYASQWGMDVEYRSEGTERDIDAETIAVVFGFVQEALTNVRKHAASAPSSVQLSFRPGSIEVQVSDEGPGFDPQGGEEPGFRLHQGLGLTRSRISLAGGRFTVTSSPGAGTTLTLEIAA
jgi:signal transduction histidine kinase